MQLIDTFQNRLKQIMSDKNIKQVDLVEKTGIDKTLINKYLSGVSNAGQINLTKLSNTLGVNEVWLMGYEAPKERDLNNIRKSDLIEDKSTILNFDNATLIDLEVDVIEIPVLGYIKAGIPIEAQEEIIDHVTIPKSWTNGNKKFYGLKLKRR
jgi:SOS-response transcriptional repressors (RecA-mediated autopeptidases)